MLSRIIVFTRTKHGADKVTKRLVADGFAAQAIHGNKSQANRQTALRRFREGEIRVLVATDVAARGIDVPDVSHVINFDVPNVPESYVHRIGRTARAGQGGHAISLCDHSEVGFLRDIERLIKRTIDRRDVPGVSAYSDRSRTHVAARRASSASRLQAAPAAPAAQPPAPGGRLTWHARSKWSCLHARPALTYYRGACPGLGAPSRPRNDPRNRRTSMAKEELLEFEGVVVDVLPDARFRVKLDNEHEIIAYTAGRMKKHRIRTLVGDRVTIEMTPYDLDKGRVIYRHKDERASTGQAPRRTYRRR